MSSSLSRNLCRKFKLQIAWVNLWHLLWVNWSTLGRRVRFCVLGIPTVIPYTSYIEFKSHANESILLPHHRTRPSTSTTTRTQWTYWIALLITRTINNAWSHSWCSFCFLFGEWINQIIINCVDNFRSKERPYQH